MKNQKTILLALLCLISVKIFAQDNITSVSQHPMDSLRIQTEEIPFSILKKQAIGKSILIPGLGDKIVRKNSKRIWMGIIGYGTLAGGFIAQSKSNSYLNAYNTSERQTEITQNRNNANKFNSISTVLWGLSGLMWTIDIGGLLSLKK